MNAVALEPEIPWRLRYGTVQPTGWTKEEQAQYADYLVSFQKRPWDWVLTCYPWGVPGSPLERRVPEKWQRTLLKHMQDVLNDETVPMAQRLNRVIRITVASGHGIGKTAMVSWIIHWFMSVFPHGEAIVTAGTRDQLDGKTWRELSKWQQLAMNGWQFTWTATRYSHVDAPTTWFAEARAWSDANPQAMAGTHEKYVLVLFDEASAISKIIWETVAGAMTSGLCFWLAFGNPSEGEGGFWETHNGREASRWWSMRVDAREVSFANLQEINGWIEDHRDDPGGEDCDFLRVRVYGMFPRQSELQFIDSGRIHAASKRVIEWRDIPRAIPRLMGVDIARQGADANVIVRRQGRKMLDQIDEWHSRDTMVTARHIADAINNWRPDLVFIDGVGIGAGVVDYLRMIGFQQVIVEVQAGLAPLDRGDAKRFKNMRAVMTWRMSEWLSTADIPPNQRLMEELASYHKKHEIKTDRMLVESKQEMMKRGVRSPNISDALAHTFWSTVPQVMGNKSGYAATEM